ncbi:MAG: monofunctional biosynthetic peptidoglycan transglycosylase [Bacteroidetes bacterium]|nr:MAG: monofunctional biosynthetic peptidoglycan transglycosylase [Bacteroidota bacterium]
MTKRIAKFIFKSLLWFVGLSVLWVILYKYVPVPYTPLMAIRSVQGDSNYRTEHDWVPLSLISQEIQLAVICAEDQKFLNHKGFDYKAIEEAYKSNKNRKSLKGGSTISQQTAKNVFLWPGRSWLRKGLETYFTFLIETIWSKERILEVYLNSIEMGAGVFGVEAAADYWFNTTANELSQHQAAAIAAILPNPRNYKASPRTNYVEKRKQWIIRQMKNFGRFELKEE